MLAFDEQVPPPLAATRAFSRPVAGVFLHALVAASAYAASLCRIHRHAHDGHIALNNNWQLSQQEIKLSSEVPITGAILTLTVQYGKYAFN